MPDERTARAPDRCAVHPRSPAIQACEGCGRPLCLTCAIPARGRVLGAECLEAAIGPVPDLDPTAAPPPEAAPARLVGAALGAALLVTTLPWSRFGAGSGAFGAWSRTFRWSMVAAVAAAVGALLWTLARRGWLGAHRLPPAVFGAVAAAGGVGALLAIAHPPPFARPSLAPWLALAACLAAVAGSVGWVRSRRPRP